jgi:hypothetical protein
VCGLDWVGEAVMYMKFVGWLVGRSVQRIWMVVAGTMVWSR